MNIISFKLLKKTAKMAYGYIMSENPRGFFAKRALDKIIANMVIINNYAPAGVPFNPDSFVKEIKVALVALLRDIARISHNTYVDVLPSTVDARLIVNDMVDTNAKVDTYLFNIARSCDDYMVRIHAIDCMTNQENLVFIASQPAFYTDQMRIAAIQHINDQKFLEKIASDTKEHSYELRSMAIRRITDQEILARMIRSDYDVTLLGVAHEQLKKHRKDLA